MKRLALVLLAALGLLAVFGAASIMWLRSESGKAWLAAEISRRAGTSGDIQVTIGRLDGDLFRRIELSDVAASDADGIWMSIRSVAIEWQPLDLLRGRLTLDLAEINDAVVQRLPETVPTEKEPTLADRLDALRSLPAVRIARFGMEDLTLGDSVLGQRAVLRVAGRIDTEAASLVRGALSIRRVDGGAGSLEVKGAYHAPEGRLALDAELNEPAGGLIARALDVPGLPRLRAFAKGDGVIADWRGKVELSFEQAATLHADVSIRHGDTTGFGLTGAAAIPPGNGGPFRRLVSGEHTFWIQGSYAPDGAVTLLQTDWTAPAFDVAATATLGLDDLALDGRASLRTSPGTPLQLTPEGMTVGALTAEVRATGRLPTPKVHLEVDAKRLSVPEALTADAGGTLVFNPDGRASGKLDGNLALESIDWIGRPALQTVLGGEATIQVAAAVDNRRSEVRVERARLGLAPGEVTGSGLFNWSTGDGTARATLAAPDLARFRTLAGMPVSGGATVSADAAMQGFGASASGTLSGKATGLTLGNAIADAVLARAADIDAELSFADGKLSVQRVAMKSGSFEAQLDGALDVATRAVVGSYRAEIGGGKPIPVTEKIAVDCACRAAGKLQGTLDELGLTGSLALRSLRVRDIALRALTADYDVSKLTGDPAGSIMLKAATPLGDASAQTKYALERGRLRLEDLQAAGGTARLRGALDLPLTDAPVEGDLDIAIASLAPWFAAAGMEGDGNTNMRIRLRADGKRQAIDGTAKIADLRFRSGAKAALITVEQATLDATTRDLLTGSGNKIDIQIGKGSAGTAKFERIVAAAQGSLAQAKLSLSMKGAWMGPLAADAAAAYAEKGGRHSLDMTTLQGTAVGEKFALRQPLRVVWSDADLRAEGLALDFGGAQLTGYIRTGRKDADIALTLAHAPLRLIDRFWHLGLVGQAEASLALKGTWPEPEGKLSLAVPSLRFKGEPDAPALKVELGGNWRHGLLAVDGKIDAGRGAHSVVEASIPLRLEGPGWTFSMPRQQPVSGSLRWSGETATLWRFAPLSEHLVRGPGNIDVRLVGTLAQPSLQGSVTLSKGYYESLEFGTVLKALDLAVAFEGRQIRVARLSASDGDAGKLIGSGWVALDPDKGFPFDLAVDLDKLTVVRRDDVQASASGKVRLSGSAEKARLESQIVTDQVEIRVLDRLPPEVATLDVVEVGRDGSRPPARKPAAATPSSDIGLAIEIGMPRRVFVRGRGIDSEWKGNIKVGGTASKPSIAGYLVLVRGQMTVVGNTFRLDSGSLFLPEAPGDEPEMSISAVHTARDLTVRAQVEGPVSTPKITLSSTPALPKEEIVSRILFNKGSSQLSVYEAAQLALALRELTGSGSGGVLDFVRKTIGVDSLEIESTETATGTVPVVGAGKYLTDDVYVNVKQGATPETSSIGVEVEVLPNISVESDVRRTGRSDVGVKFKLDY